MFIDLLLGGTLQAGVDELSPCLIPGASTLTSVDAPVLLHRERYHVCVDRDALLAKPLPEGLREVGTALAPQDSSMTPLQGNSPHWLPSHIASRLLA